MFFIIKNNLIEFKYICKYLDLNESIIEELINNNIKFEWKFVFKYLNLSKKFKNKYKNYNQSISKFIFNIFK
jgi:hypothetical protein